MQKTFLAAALTVATFLAGTAQAATVLINEFQPNPPGSDPAETTIELIGDAGSTFSGVLYQIDGDQGVSGQVDEAIALTGIFDASGLLTLTIADIENPSFTLILASGGASSVGDDLDADNDGTLDLGFAGSFNAFGTVFDAVSIVDTATDFGYAGQVGGTDFGFIGAEPELVFRDGTTGEWLAIEDLNDDAGVVNESGDEIELTVFNIDPRTPTFGAVNPTATVSEVPLPPAMALSLLALGALGAIGRRR